MWNKLLASFLHRLIKHGALILVDPNGRSQRFGEVLAAPVSVSLHDTSLPRRLLADPDLVLGEAYMDGTLTIAEDDLYGLVELLLINLNQQKAAWHYRWLAAVRRALRGFAQFNPVARARKNAAHHYDLSSRLYALFLDDDRQYSCAYFEHPSDSLKVAQAAKKAHIATKLLLKPGHRVLDIGCGWGGLALDLNQACDAHVTGITLSVEQHKFACDRARKTGRSDEVQFRLEDYRNVSGTFDRIVSVGMFEHLGIPHFRQFFNKLRDTLSDDGVALIHTIGRFDGPDATNPWIAKYIFPGGYIPALSEILPIIERVGLYVTDIEILRLHYAQTLRIWRSRFEANRAQIRELYDERFCRMWTYYLVVSELAFRRDGYVVFQLQLAKQQDAVPLTRNYLASTEPAQMRTARVA